MPYHILINDHDIPNLFIYTHHTNVECMMHLHMSMEFILVTSGTLNMTIGSKDYSIPKGFAVFVTPFEPHQFQSNEPNECIVLLFRKEAAHHYFDYLATHAANSHLFPFSPECISLIEQILSDQITHTTFKAQAILAPLFYAMHENCHFHTKKTTQDDFLVRASKYLNEHFTENVTLESTAKILGMHPVTLSKTFAQKAQINFNSYLNYLRCSHAAVLLHNSDTTCTEAAYAAGFGSIRSFNRAFRLIYGVTPTEFKATQADSQ